MVAVSACVVGKIHHVIDKLENIDIRSRREHSLKARGKVPADRSWIGGGWAVADWRVIVGMIQTLRADDVPST